jgi:hypothetical protein
MTCPHPEKMSYESTREAWAAIEGARRRGYTNRDLQPYTCSCGAIHLRHSGRSLGERIRKALDPADD